MTAFEPRAAGFDLWAGSEPLGEPVALLLARRVVDARGRTEALHPDGEQLDFMLAIAGFNFETLWRDRRTGHEPPHYDPPLGAGRPHPTPGVLP